MTYFCVVITSQQYGELSMIAPHTLSYIKYRGTEAFLKAKRVVKGAVAPDVAFGASDYGLLATPHRMGMGENEEQRAHFETMHDMVVGEVVGSMAARLAASWVKDNKIQSLRSDNPALTDEEILSALQADGTVDFLDKLPLRLIGGTHIVMAAMYTAKGDFQNAAMTGAFGGGDIVMTLQRPVDADNPQAPNWFESAWRNGPLWFAGGLVCATGHAAGPEAAAAMALPIGAGAYYAIKNSRTMHEQGLPFPPNEGKPFVWSAGATTAASVAGVAALGSEFVPALQQAMDAVMNGVPISSEEDKVKAFTSLAVVSNIIIGSGYIMFEQQVGDAFKDLKSAIDKAESKMLERLFPNGLKGFGITYSGDYEMVDGYLMVPEAEFKRTQSESGPYNINELPAEDFFVAA